MPVAYPLLETFYAATWGLLLGVLLGIAIHALTGSTDD
jgi:hypothetical protein